MTELEIPFPDKLQFLFEPHPYKIAYGGRDGTKSWGFAIALVELAADRKLRIVCARETMKSIQDSVHKLLGATIRRLNLGHRFDIQQSTILGTNGSEFLFVGLKHNVDSIKSLEGADILWVEEAQSVSESSWDIVLPTIRKPGAEVWVSFNPDLETDPTYKRFVLKPPPGAMVVKIGWEDNRWLSERSKIDIEHMRATDPEKFRHIYGGECQSAVEGAVYGQEMREALEQGRICSVPVDRTRPVNTYWDLGYGDYTAIWLAQVLDSGHVRLLDYIQDRGKTIEHYIIQLQQRKYVYGVDWLPHDAVDTIIHSRLAGDKTRSIEQLMRAAGRNVRIAAKLHVHTGINAARTILPNCWFDEEKCADGLMALRHYQWGEPAANGIERREPLHDWASHGADAFRTLAVCAKPDKILESGERTGWRPPPRPPGGGRHGWIA